MRYGVVRSLPDHPALSVQRRLIEAAGCDTILEQSGSHLSSHRRLLVMLLGLQRGDEVIVHTLDSLDLTTGELARLLRRFFEVGVTLKIVGGSRCEVLAPEGTISRVLALLADHEMRRPVLPEPRRRARSVDTPLTQHQLKYARDMHRRGHSMRAIGLLFRLSPNEVARLLRASRALDNADGPGLDGDRSDLTARPSPQGH